MATQKNVDKVILGIDPGTNIMGYGAIHQIGLKVEMLAMEFNNGSRQSVICHAPGYTDDLIDSFIMSCYYFVEEENKVEFFKMGDYDEY